MASTATDLPSKPPPTTTLMDPEKTTTPTYRPSSTPAMKSVRDSTHRKLKPRHIQLIGIGGTIGTALYVQIGRGLMNGGPASLFLAFSIWYVCLIMCVNVRVKKI